ILGIAGQKLLAGHRDSGCNPQLRRSRPATLRPTARLRAGSRVGGSVLLAAARGGSPSGGSAGPRPKARGPGSLPVLRSVTRLPDGRPRDQGAYCNPGAMICAKLFRARFNLLFTVPRFTPVISEISSYVLPSISRRTNTTR